MNDYSSFLENAALIYVKTKCMFTQFMAGESDHLFNYFLFPSVLWIDCMSVTTQLDSFNAIINIIFPFLLINKYIFKYMFGAFYSVLCEISL